MGLGKQPKPQAQTVNQKSEPWAAQAPYLQDLFSRAKSDSLSLPEYFKESTVASRSGDTINSLNMFRNAAGGMQPGINQTMAQAMFNMGPAQNMEANPYLQAAIRSATNPIMDQFQNAGGTLSNIRSHFMSGNSGGSGTREGVATAIASNQLGRTLADMSSGMTMNAYQQAQQNAMQTMGMMPQLLNMQTMPAQLVGQVGAANDNYAQMLLNDQVNRHNFNQNRETAALQNYAQMISGNYGGTQSGVTTTPGPTKSPLMSGMGGALSGAMLGSMMGGPMMPFALGGGLLGLLG